MLILRIGVVIVQAIIGSSGTPWMCGTRPEAMSHVFLSRYHSFWDNILNVERHTFCYGKVTSKWKNSGPSQSNSHKSTEIEANDAPGGDAP